MSYPLVRVRRLDIDSFAAAGGMHPDVIRKLVALGILDAAADSAGGLWFGRDQLAALARVQRLHAAFPLNYAAIGLVTDLLDRISVLEAALRRARRLGGR
jgi:chaperone modulatory protein CbpM